MVPPLTEIFDPINVLLFPKVSPIPVLYPKKVLLLPDILSDPANEPIAVLFWPTVVLLSE